MCTFLRTVLRKFLLERHKGAKLVVETQGKAPSPGRYQGMDNPMDKKKKPGGAYLRHL